MLNLAPEETDDGAPFSMEVTNGPDCAAFTVAGEVDACTAPRLRDAFRAAAASSGAITVDMSAVSFLDSSGVSALIGGYKTASGNFRVVNPSRQVRRVLQLTGQLERFVGDNSPA